MFEEDEFKILKKQAGELEVPVRDNVWKNISSRIGKSQYQNVRLRRIAHGLFVALLIGIGFLYMLENSRQDKLSISDEPYNTTDTFTDIYNKQDNHTNKGNHYFVPRHSVQNKNPLAKKSIIEGTATKWRETGNKIKGHKGGADLDNRADIDLLFNGIASRPFPPLELSLSYIDNNVLHKLKALKPGTSKPQKRITFSSADIGFGTNFSYSKKQPETSSPLEQSYAQYIHNASEKMLPLYGRMMVNFELPRGLSIGTGLQFIHLRESVSYALGYDSIVEIVDDGRGTFDTNIIYYNYSLPGIGFSSESRTSQFQLPLLMNLSWKLNKKLNVGLNAGINIGLYSLHRSNSKHRDIPGIASFMMRQDHSTFFYSLGVQASAGFEYRISSGSCLALKLNYYRTIGNKSEPMNSVQRSFGSELVYRLTIR